MIIGKGGFISNQDDFELSNSKSGIKKEKVNEREYYSLDQKWLELSINKSLEQLKVNCLDVFLIHNPETLFQFEAENLSEKQKRENVQNKIIDSFQFLNTLVSKGKIKSYGISCNTLAENSSHPSFISLSDLHRLSIQQDVHQNFLAVQFPFNLLEPGALVNKNQNSDTLTLLQYAKVKSIFFYFFNISLKKQNKRKMIFLV